MAENWLKLAGLSHFYQISDISKKQLLAVKIKPLNQSWWNFAFSKLKKFLIGGKKDNAIEKHLGARNGKNPLSGLLATAYNCGPQHKGK